MLIKLSYKKYVFILLVILLSGNTAKADEGMWPLPLLKKYNAQKMTDLGLKLPIDTLDGAKGGSLSEAIVAFGGGCTGSIISGKGLILTNYHCSYGAIQEHNSQERDIVNNGYWAKNNKEELPAKGLTVTINKGIYDVTDNVLKIAGGNKAKDVTALRSAIGELTGQYKKKYPDYKITIKSYNNSLFILYMQVVYEDIRIVGVAPKNVAKFGGETDNWMWPRHSADFAYFRVYTDSKGKPAKYSTSNIPLISKVYIKVSNSGYDKDDFAMSMGYPSNTNRSSYSSKIWEVRNVLNPPLIASRAIRQSILEEEMAKSPSIRAKYFSTYSESANYYKNAVGMNYWIDKTDLISKKAKEEKGWNKNFGDDKLLDIKERIVLNRRYKSAFTYFREALSDPCDVLNFVSSFSLWMKHYKGTTKPGDPTIEDFHRNVTRYYKNVDIDLDKRVTKKMIKLVLDSVDKDLLPDFYNKISPDGSNIGTYVDSLFSNSIYSDTNRIKKWLKKPYSSYDNDPLVQLQQSIDRKKSELARSYSENESVSDRLISSFVKSVSDSSRNRFYPDADRTLRLSYGKISDLKTSNITYPFQTTLSELIIKGESVNPDYKINPILREVWNQKDFGIYGNGKDIPVCFITDGDVTGGNSGSPMLNSEGKLIGLVFDCNWESMTRDYRYDKELNRVICLDARYMLFITQKFSGSVNLINEILF